jgi:alkaline phosphatase D
MPKIIRSLVSPKITKRGFMRLLAFGGSLLPALSLLSTRSHAQASLSKARVLQGPMLGAVTPTSIQVWVRVSDEFLVVIEISESPRFEKSTATQPVRVQLADDLAVTVSVSNLKPGTGYFYRVLLDGKRGGYSPDVPVHHFATAPEPGSPVVFSVATGSCARYAVDPDQVIWRAVDSANPDLFAWLGDNIYGDSAQTTTLNAEYQRQRGARLYQSIAPRIPQLAIWDDHDFGINNGDRTNPFKDKALKSFRKYWANPAYGLDGTPGVFFEYQYGGVDFFFLDVRYYRDPNAAPDGEGKTMLGAAQKRWLKARLKASNAPFKVLLSGSGWSVAKGPGDDSWAAFLTERNELFNYVRDEGISGVVLVSGDTHVAELNAIPWSDKGGYDYYDLTSSPLAQETSDSFLERRPETRIRQVYFGSVNFGLLRFDMRSTDPLLEYNVINYRGDAVWEPLRLRASELVNGMATWKDKMDALSRSRYDSVINGGEYYEPLPYFR